MGIITDTLSASTYYNLPSSDYTENVINISSGQILTMGVTPIELLPLAGVGKYYDWYGFIEYTHVSTPYTTSDLLLQNGIGNNIGYVYSQYVLMGQAASSVTKIEMPRDYVGSPNYFVTGYNFTTNCGVFLTTESGVNPTNGDGTLRIVMYYKTRTFGM